MRLPAIQWRNLTDFARAALARMGVASRDDLLAAERGWAAADVIAAEYRRELRAHLRCAWRAAQQPGSADASLALAQQNVFRLTARDWFVRAPPEAPGPLAREIIEDEAAQAWACEGRAAMRRLFAAMDAQAKKTQPAP